jgi:phosphoribosylformimino-5-aminoimidazole carboxamide ribotide isomerase
MLIIPAIDLRGGNCVRLVQGDPDRQTIYSSDPVEQALKFENEGAGLLHIVDLDGAFSGRPVNHGIISEIMKALTIPVEVGGGIRTPESVQTYIDMGVKRIILGTALFDPGLEEMISRYPEYIVAGIDAKNSFAATHGWQNLSNYRAVDLIKELKKKGISEYIYTDISTDGMLTGPNHEQLKEIIAEIKGISLVASGGVSRLEDIIALALYPEPGLMGCIVGKAIYDGRVNFREAVLRIKNG